MTSILGQREVTYSVTGYGEVKEMLFLFLKVQSAVQGETLMFFWDFEDHAPVLPDSRLFSMRGLQGRLSIWTSASLTLTPCFVCGSAFQPSWRV